MSSRTITAALISAAVAAGALGCGQATTPPPVAPRVFIALPSASAPSGARAVATPTQHAARKLSGRFVPAYLRWEVDRATPADVRTLRGSSTSAVTTANFSAPPRQPNADQIPPQARLVSTAVPVSRESESPGAVAVIVELSRSGRREQMTLVVAPEGGRARVVDLVPPQQGVAG